MPRTLLACLGGVCLFGSAVAQNCTNGNGLYCAGDGVTGFPNTLYRCANGAVSVAQVCASGCTSMPPGIPDACSIPASCQNGNGAYCGGHGIGGDPNTLYQCTNGNVSVLQACANGCTREPAGVADECAAPPPSGCESCGTAFCVHGEIRNHYDNLLGGCSSKVVGVPASNELPSCISGDVYQHFSLATMFWSPATDAWEFHGAIRDHFYALGAECSGNGLPITNEKGTPDGVGRYNHFLDNTQGSQIVAAGTSISSNRSIYWHPQAGAHQVRGAIRIAWAENGWEQNWGYPVSDEITQTNVIIKQSSTATSTNSQPLTATASVESFAGAWSSFFATNADLTGTPEDGAYATYYANGGAPYPNPVVTPSRLKEHGGDMCYGAQGSGCTVGGGLDIANTCQTPDANGITTCKVSIGAQLHDSCCEHHPNGSFCGGNNSQAPACAVEFQHAINDALDGYSWDWKYSTRAGASHAVQGPIDLAFLVNDGNSCDSGDSMAAHGHTTAFSIRAPAGVSINLCDFRVDNNWCQSGQADTFFLSPFATCK